MPQLLVIVSRRHILKGNNVIPPKGSPRWESVSRTWKETMENCCEALWLSNSLVWLVQCGSVHRFIVCVCVHYSNLCVFAVTLTHVLWIYISSAVLLTSGISLCLTCCEPAWVMSGQNTGVSALQTNVVQPLRKNLPSSNVFCPPSILSIASALV